MYKRKLRLVATDLDSGDLLFSTTEHRITFEVDIKIAQGMSTSTIVIYNLGDDEVKALQRADLEPSSEGDGTANREPKRVRLQLFAGYEDEVESDLTADQLMIEGLIMNATTVKKLPSKLTYLYVIAYGSNILVNKFDSFSVPGLNSPNPMTLEDVINRVVKSAGYESVDFSSVNPEKIGEKTIKDLRGKPINNTDQGMFGVLDDLAEQYRFSWGIKAKGVGIYPPLDDSKADSQELNYLIGEYESKNKEGLLIDPIKVKGTPIAGMATLEIKHVLDATLFPGILIDVGEVGGKQDNDSLPDEGLIDYTALGKSIFYTNDVAKYAVFQYYMLWRVVHKGDSHGDEWDTTLVCKVPSVGMSANEEI